ncbi:T9SS type A sorting domain-containing protein [bacterium SCSIO 12741]|nr:T9SS type A sorting domain-containing protein [bacterium SCSIO 12741]
MKMLPAFFVKVLTLCLLLSLSALTSRAFVQVSSAQMTTTTPTDCDTISYTIGGSLGASNYTYTGTTWSVSGSTLTIDVNYTSGLIILPVIVQFTHFVDLTGIPSGTYTVVVRGMLSGSQSSVFNGAPNLTVAKCCAVKANFIAGASSYCLGDTISHTNISSSSSSQVWYANNLAVDTNFHLNKIATVPGVYTYKLKANSPCGSDSIEKNVLVLDNLKMHNDTDICLNDNLVLNAPPGWDSYSWSDRSRKQSLTVTQSGTYGITVTADNGCKQIDSVKVNVVGPAFSLGPDTSFCYQDSLILDAGAIWDTVSWFQRPTNRYLTVDSAGVYVAEVTNSLGCRFLDAIKVTESGANIEVTGSDTVCEGDTVWVEVQGTEWTQFSWSDGSNTRRVAAPAMGRLIVTATNADGCVRTDTANIGHYFVPTVHLGSDTTLCMGDSLLLDVTQTNSTYVWQDSSTGSSWLVDTAGFYFVEVTNADGCSGADSIRIALMDCDTVIQEPDGIAEEQVNRRVVVYPNPSTGEIFLRSLTHSEEVQVEVYGVTGNRVFSEQLDKYNGTYVLHLESLTQGTWFVHWITPEGREVIPIQLISSP